MDAIVATSITNFLLLFRDYINVYEKKPTDIMYFTVSARFIFFTLIAPNITAGLALYPGHTGQSDAKPTSNRHKSSNSGRDRFTVGTDSVLSVLYRFMFGQTDMSGRDLSNMFERSLPDKLSVVCRYVVGLLSVWVRDCPSHLHVTSMNIGPYDFLLPSCRMLLFQRY